MGKAWATFAGAVAVALSPVAQAFIVPATSRLSHQTAFGPIRSRSFFSEPTFGCASDPNGRVRRPAGITTAPADGGVSAERRSQMAVAVAAGDGGDARGEDEGSAVPAGKTAEPIGAAGAMEDDLLMEIVGQDYGMMALLRNDKFRSLIVLLRNIPPDEWVTEVAKAYPDDDEIKGMMGQVGKLMKMISYYQAKNLKK